jgi:hypothetical protein
MTPAKLTEAFIRSRADAEAHIQVQTVSRFTDIGAIRAYPGRLAPSLTLPLSRWLTLAWNNW